MQCIKLHTAYKIKFLPCTSTCCSVLYSLMSSELYCFDSRTVHVGLSSNNMYIVLSLTATLVCVAILGSGFDLNFTHICSASLSLGCSIKLNCTKLCRLLTEFAHIITKCPVVLGWFAALDYCSFTVLCWIRMDCTYTVFVLDSNGLLQFYSVCYFTLWLHFEVSVTEMRSSV